MSSWKIGADGYWTNMANWNGGVPNAPGAVADFTFSTSPNTRTNVVYFDQNEVVTVGTLNISGGDTWQFRTPVGVTNATLRFEGASGGYATINVTSSRFNSFLANTGLNLAFVSDVVLTGSGNRFEILAPITGAGDLFKSSSSTLLLGPDNAGWSGDSHLQQKRTEITGSNSLGTGIVMLSNDATLAAQDSLTLANRIEFGTGNGAISEMSSTGTLTLSGQLVLAGNDPDKTVQFGFNDGFTIDKGVILLTGTSLVTGLGGFTIRSGTVRLGNADVAANYFSSLSTNAFVHVAGVVGGVNNARVDTNGFATSIDNLDLQGGSVLTSSGTLNLTVNYTAGSTIQSGTVFATAGIDVFLINVFTSANLSGVTLSGWAKGVDTFTLNGSDADNVIVGANVPFNYINGNGGNDTLIGGFYSDVIDGGDGDDLLDGGFVAPGALGSGPDTLRGGAGNDTYVVDDANDVVIELVGGGNDLVTVSNLGYVLTAGAEVETLSTTDAAGFAAIALTGNEFGQTIIGNAGANFLSGGGGADILDGGAGSDTIIVDGDDMVIEAVGGGTNDLVAATSSFALNAGAQVETLSTTNGGSNLAINLTGNEFGQKIIGNAGNNFLSGGGGADTLDGGAGNDVIIVDADDLVTEAAGGGNDLVAAMSSFALNAGAEVETLSTTNGGSNLAINLTGNEFGQTIIGNAGANFLSGGGGADTLDGGAGADVIIVDGDDQVIEAAGGGNDLVAAMTSYALNAGAEVETLSTTNGGSNLAIALTGNEFGQTIIGNAGNNFLNGGGGADILNGGAGNDVIIVDQDDLVIEAASGGNDLVASLTSYTLNAGAEVETLSTTYAGGIGAINLTGNAFGQLILGNAGNNVLDGGLGADTLTGGGGADMFAFTTALGGGNVDAITDFVHGTDKIALDDAIFGAGIGTPGAFNANAFVTGTAAGDADDRIIYNSATGELFYDADGSGAGAAVLFATMQGAPTLSASDFQVI